MRVSGDDSGDYELRAFSSITGSAFFSCDFSKNAEIIKVQNAFLAVVPAVTPLRDPKDAFRKQGPIYRSISSSTSVNRDVKGIWGREIQQGINFGDVQEWLRFCRTNHRGHCMRHRQTDKSILRGFRL